MGLIGAILALVFAGGVVLTVIGWRGRKVNDHPYCGTCRFDLSGLLLEGGEVPKCPECGTPLRGAGAKPLIYGLSVRRRTPLICGITLLMVLGALFVLMNTPSAAALDRAMPVVLLRMQARWGGTSARARIIKELSRRLYAGELDQEQVDEITTDILKVQANPSAKWDELWGEFMEDALAKGLVSVPDANKFAQQAIDSIDLTVYTPHLSGQSVFPRFKSRTKYLGFGTRMGEGSTESTNLNLTARGITLTIDGVDIPMLSLGRPYFPWHLLDPMTIGQEGDLFFPGALGELKWGIEPYWPRNANEPYGMFPRIEASPGRHKLSITMRFEPKPGGAWRVIQPFDRTYVLDFNVCDAVDEWVHVVDRKSEGHAFDSGLKVTRVGPAPLENGSSPIRIMVTFQSTTRFRLHGVAGRVLLRDATGTLYGLETSLGNAGIGCTREGSPGYSELVLKVEDWEQALANQPIDVIVTPDYRMLAPFLHGNWDRSSDWTSFSVTGSKRIEAGRPSFWNDEIVFEDVPIDKKPPY
jgi:hypothetical protein